MTDDSLKKLLDDPEKMRVAFASLDASARQAAEQILKVVAYEETRHSQLPLLRNPETLRRLDRAEADVDTATETAL